MTESLSSQRTQRMLFQAMEEVLGAGGLHSVMQAAYEPADDMGGSHWISGEAVPAAGTAVSAPFISRVLEAFEGVYGAQAGRGLALRVGRATLSYGLREYGADIGLTGPGFRLLPLPTKLRTFGKALAGLINDPTDERLQVEEQEEELLVHLLHCPLCSGRKASEVVCQLAVGLAEESLYWLSGGKTFHVVEIACAARGDDKCTLQIDKAPIS